jgi:23S rRNA-/tRNA-specific pseudouridylate synthase
VNHQKTTPDTIVKRQDLLSHAVHRHEPPVTDQPIEIIYQDNDLVVINKPGSIQVSAFSFFYRLLVLIYLLGTSQWKIST